MLATAPLQKRLAQIGQIYTIHKKKKLLVCVERRGSIMWQVWEVWDVGWTVALLYAPVCPLLVLGTQCETDSWGLRQRLPGLSQADRSGLRHAIAYEDTTATQRAWSSDVDTPSHQVCVDSSSERENGSSVQQLGAAGSTAGGTAIGTHTSSSLPPLRVVCAGCTTVDGSAAKATHGRQQHGLAAARTEWTISRTGAAARWQRAWSVRRSIAGGIAIGTHTSSSLPPLRVVCAGCTTVDGSAAKATHGRQQHGSAAAQTEWTISTRAAAGWRRAWSVRRSIADGIAIGTHTSSSLPPLRVVCAGCTTAGDPCGGGHAWASTARLGSGTDGEGRRYLYQRDSA